VYDHVCFSINVYLFCLPYMRVNMQPLFFRTWLISLNMISFSCIHFTSKHMVSFFHIAE
jgi:hypothetical protein